MLAEHGLSVGEHEHVEGIYKSLPDLRELVEHAVSKDLLGLETQGLGDVEDGHHQLGDVHELVDAARTLDLGGDGGQEGGHHGLDFGMEGEGVFLEEGGQGGQGRHYLSGLTSIGSQNG